MPGDAPNQSIQRTVRILYLLAGEEGGLTVRQIANQIGIKANTAYRVIKSMEFEQLVERRKDPLRFVIGRAVAELARLDEERHLLSTAGQLLLSHQKQHRSASFVFVEMDQSQFYTRLRASSERPGILIRERKSIHSLYETSSSLLFLAYASPLLARKLEQAAPFEVHGKPHWKSRLQLDDFLKKTRRLGYCLPHLQSPYGPLVAVAAPIFSAGHEVIASIGAYIPGSKIPKREIDQMISLCRSCANKLSGLV